MITLDGVTKRFSAWPSRNVITSLREVSLAVPRGEVLGIAGQNGAGKSTMISLILGYLRQTRGVIRVGGMEPRTYVQSRGISYLPEIVTFPPRWTVESTLSRLSALGNGGSRSRNRTRAAIETVGLEEHRQKRVNQLSKGLLQRLGLAQALLEDSEIVVFDEPTNGMDPLWTHRFRDLVRTIRHGDRTIVIASHNLDELERVADRVAILDHGRLERLVTPGSVGGSSAWRIVLAGPVPEALLLGAFPMAVAVDGRLQEYRVHGGIETVNAGIVRLLAGGGSLAAFHSETNRVEAEFHAAIAERRPEPHP